ncbi:DUF309 domain-containing protein [Sneathiella aquimaris]|uniref:DUF309 domain-containing protein n=1 Tax=Sneathiella aquimaris TaxID=2599305 RepID=UPI00146DDF35|nr:DUF309 domain-containing protein [Sneathiella aquimaris]
MTLLVKEAPYSAADILPQGPMHRRVGDRDCIHAETKRTIELFMGRDDRVSLKSLEKVSLGCVFFEAGYYWEAHEVWEGVWLECLPNSAEKFFLQAMIQLTNAKLKKDLGRFDAAVRLGKLSRALLEQAFSGKVESIYQIRLADITPFFEGFKSNNDI